MNFLLDQNISYRVIRLLLTSFENVKQVKDFNLIDATGAEIWKFSFENNFTIITFDSDFIDLANIKGSPPKIIWLRFVNSSNLYIANKLISNADLISEFILNSELAFLEID